MLSIRCVCEDAQYLRETREISEKFQEFPLLRINVEKCDACWIGRAKNRNTKPVKCNWTSLTKCSIKILGIFSGIIKLCLERIIFFTTCRCLDCRTSLNILKQRWLSLAGKTLAFKSQVASKLVYLATMTPVPQNFCDTLKALHKNFLSSRKKPKIEYFRLKRTISWPTILFYYMNIFFIRNVTIWAIRKIYCQKNLTNCRCIFWTQ